MRGALTALVALGALGIVALGAVLAVALFVGARRDSNWIKPAVLGVVAGAAMILGGLWVMGVVDDLGWDVSPEEVQLAAINALLEDQPLSRGMRLHATVHYGGQSCGGVVELTTTASSHIYVVGHDSGAPMAGAFDGTVSEAIEDLRRRGYDCPDL